MPKFEILSVAPADPPQWTGDHGTFNAYELQLKGEDGAVFKAGVNQKPTSPEPTPGFVYGEAWQNENGFWKFKRDRAAPKSTGPANYTSGPPGDDPVQRMIIRQHSQGVALQYAALAGETDLNKIEAWTDHFDADVQRASGQAAASPPPPPAQASNGGEPKITDPQIKLVLARQKMHSIPNDDMARLVQLFHIEKLKDLPRGSVDDFLTAMVNPIPTGSSDVSSEFTSEESEEDRSLPF